MFSKDRGLKKAIDKVRNVHAQSPDRWAAMEKLRDIGSDEALFGLCRRFSYNYDKSIEDQQEKGWVVDALASKGEASIDPLRRYMKNANTLGYPLMTLSRVADKDQALAVIDEILAAEEPGYTRDPKRRIDIIEWLSEWPPASDEEVASRVAPYLVDFDENVRFKTVEALAHNPAPSAAPALVAALLEEEEESQRLKVRIAEVLAESAMPLGDKAGAVAELTSNVLSSFKVVKGVLEKKL